MLQKTAISAMAILLFTGCEALAGDPIAEPMPELTPNLPAVPTVPPPPHPITYQDSSYSIYGLRRRMSATMDQEVSVTGTIVRVYEPPECEGEEACARPEAPHVWIADTADEGEDDKLLMIVGYAERQSQIDDARRRRRRPRDGEQAIPTDLDLGNKIRVTGQFARSSSGGFSASNGLLVYASHETQETADN